MLSKKHAGKRKRDLERLISFINSKPMEEEKNSFVCHDCFKLRKCKEPLLTWVFFAIALIATISIRAVNVVLDFNPVLAKVFWYLGVGGFCLFFVYKFRHHNRLHKELAKTGLSEKLLAKEKLSDHDRELLGTIICQLSSKKDKINYFAIFLFSGLALIISVYVDFFR